MQQGEVPIRSLSFFHARKGEDIMKQTISIAEKAMLTVDEAAAYFNIGPNKLREMTNSEDCPYVLWSGSRRLIKRKLFEEYLNSLFSV